MGYFVSAEVGKVWHRTSECSGEGSFFNKDFSRSAVDLSLEQTVNRDAASQMKGIVAFRNSESAMRRWSVTMTQRAVAVSELRTFAGLEIGENATAQCRPCRIKKDNEQMVGLSAKIEEFCNPFADDASGPLINIATGHAASQGTQEYLLKSLKRGTEERQKFLGEWSNDSTRFLKPVKRIRVQNFAAENVKQKAKLPASTMSRTTAAESMRDIFIRMLVVIAEKTSFDLKKVLAYPIISFPLALAHSDGSPIKTSKSTLLNKLEEMQTEQLTETDLPQSYSEIYDGGLLLHTVLSKINMGASYASIAKALLSVVCSGRGNEVHVCLDKYLENSIKDSERNLRGAMDRPFNITGPEQTIRQNGTKLLTNGNIKNALAKFIMSEWQKKHYFNFFRGKTVIVSFGGECYQYVVDEQENIIVTCPANLQADHEEADTLIAFHVANINSGSVLVRASDTDVLIILIGALGGQRPEVRSMVSVIMDCGQLNKRRYINVSNITNVLEERQAGLARGLLGLHAFTGCDFTSAFLGELATKVSCTENYSVY